MSYKSSRQKSELEHTIEANVGRVRIGEFTLQIDNDLPTPFISRDNGQLSVSAYFFGPKDTPDGLDIETGISVYKGKISDGRFADVPVAILWRAVPMAETERTRRMIERFINHGQQDELHPLEIT